MFNKLICFLFGHMWAIHFIGDIYKECVRCGECRFVDVEELKELLD